MIAQALIGGELEPDGAWPGIVLGQFLLPEIHVSVLREIPHPSAFHHLEQ